MSEPSDSSTKSGAPIASPMVALDFGQVQVQVLVEPLTEANFALHLREEATRIKTMLGTQMGSAPRKAVVVNHPSVPMPTTPAMRKLQAQWLRENEELLRLVCHAVGFVLPNPMVRYTLTAVLWLAPLPVPMVAHVNLERAIDWAIAEAEKIGGDVSSELLLGGASAIERRILALERTRHGARSA